MTGERFISPCPPPNAHEREILIILMEECAEVQQRAAKLLRFGRDEVQPGQPFSNAERLTIELGDLLAMIDLAAEADLIDQAAMLAQTERKREKLSRFMQTDSAQ